MKNLAAFLRRCSGGKCTGVWSTLCKHESKKMEKRSQIQMVIPEFNKLFLKCFQPNLKIYIYSFDGPCYRPFLRGLRQWWVHYPHNGTVMQKMFLAATKQLYDWFSSSVCLSVRPSVRLSVTPFSPCSHHHIIMKFSGVITNDKSDVHAKGQGQRSEVKGQGHRGQHPT